MRLRPGDAYALASRGFAYLALDQPVNALADFDAALKIESRLAESLFGSGLAKVRTGDKVGGDAAIDAAKAIRGDIVEQIRTMGIM
jgi:hypothetical protein